MGKGFNMNSRFDRPPPPPFPFVEKWGDPSIDPNKWLLPRDPNRFFRQHHQSKASDMYETPIVSSTSIPDDHPAESGSDFEYGYVLTEEWRNHFAKAKAVKKKKKKKANKALKKKIQEERTAKEIARKDMSQLIRGDDDVVSINVKLYGDAATQINSYVALLNNSFDQFCDTKEPVVWPLVPLK